MDKIEITGTYQTTFYRDKKTGNCAFTMQSSQKVDYRNTYGSINCKGNIPVLNKGMPIHITGEWQKTTKGSYYLLVDTISEATEDADMVIRYLKSSSFAGIGEKLATNIVAYTGCDIFRFAKKHENAEELICENIKGITQNAVHQMLTELNSTYYQQELYDFIKQVGGTFEHAEKLYNLYKGEALAKIRENPFLGFLCGMDFYLCDALSYRMNYRCTGDTRLESIIYTAIDDCLSSGSTIIPLPLFCRQIKRIENRSVYQEEIHILRYLSMLPKLKNICVFQVDGQLYITRTTVYEQEKTIVKHINRLNNSKAVLPFSTDQIKNIEEHFHIEYGKSQKEALSCLSSSGVKIITGGPGTGKTTVIRGFISLIKQMFPEEEILLLAPTGRAAQRMKETTGHSSLTIHKGIGFKPYGDEENAEKNENNPLDYRFILVDEVSMIDTMLMSMLLSAIQNGATLLLFGDIDQLPSVGIGNVLKDLIQFPNIPVYRLTDVYRQSGDSTILYNELLFQQEDFTFREADDFRIIRCKSEQEIYEKIMKTIEEEYNPINPFHTQVLSPIRKQGSGTVELNKGIQKLVNQSEKNILYSGIHYKTGDKVMFLVNNYDLEYFNGDIGMIEEITEKEVIVSTADKLIELPLDKLEDISLAYTITIHKSQGSEFPIVLIALPKTNMLNRNLLFTAITRASQKVYIFSEDDALELALSNRKAENRLSSLAWIQSKNIKIISIAA